MKNKLTKVIALTTATMLAVPVFAAGTNMGQGTSTHNNSSPEGSVDAGEGRDSSGALDTTDTATSTADTADTNGNYRRDNIDPNQVLDRSTIPESTTVDSNVNVPAETTTLTEHSPTKVKEVQRALDSRGFSVGSVDGMWGSQTRSALKEFQASNGLEATGELNDETYNALGITSERSMDDEMYSE